MERVQAALKAQLTRQNEKLEIELREKVWQPEITEYLPFSLITTARDI